jgi:hypothetical protein
VPDLAFRILEADALPYAATPTMLFKLKIENLDSRERIQSILLRSQIRIEVTRRQYDSRAEERLIELFGEPHRWGETLRSLLWMHTSSVVQAFESTTVAELPVPCTYDFEVVGSKYFHALDDGEVPLLFLFSGSVFYTREGGPLQIAQISWEKEAQYRLPIRIWKDTMDSYFPNSGWIRVRKDVFDRLCSYKAHRALPTWEDAFDALLEQSSADLEH